MLIGSAELAPGCVRDLRIVDGRVAELAEHLAARPGEDVVDALGCAVLPGLHDHHVHLRALAAARASVDAREARRPEEFDRMVREAHARCGSAEWIRVVGYHESVAGPLDRTRLDRLAPGAPVRVQHRSGALWVLSSVALEQLGLDRDDERGVDSVTGHLLRRDDLLRRISDASDPDALAAIGHLAAARGVTGFTDATPDGTAADARALARELRAAGVAQRLLLMGPVGAHRPDTVGAELGPVKVLLDDHSLPGLDDLVATVAAAHHEGRVVAIHCVTRVQLVLALVALESAGPAGGDRIEHGSVVPHDLIGRLAHADVTVVTQPHFVAERGDEYLELVEPDDVDSLYRLRSLRDAGVTVAAGTDAPFGGPDPWASVAAAVDRTTRRGQVIGPDERLTRREAVDLFLGRPEAPGRRRRIEIGTHADLCVIDRPWAALWTSSDAPGVRATLVAGEAVHMTHGL